MKAFLPFAWDRVAQRSDVGGMRAAFYCAEIFDTQALAPSAPARPDYLLFTSQNAIRTFLTFGWPFQAMTAYCVGAKTFATAQAAGLNAAYLGPPPAVALQGLLPPGQGLWLSGVDVAQDLPLPRLPIYRRTLRVATAARVQTVLQTHKIRNIFITSEGVAKWAGGLSAGTSVGIGFDGAAVLSARLAAAAKEHLPGLQRLWTVPDFESGVRTLYTSPFTGGKITEGC